jgi:hypothetical protein
MSDSMKAGGVLDGAEAGDSALGDLLAAPSQVGRPTQLPSRIDGALIGALIAFTDDGMTPLVIYDGQPSSAAVRARATIDLHAAHVGGQVVLVFERGDPLRPLIVGRLGTQEGNSAGLPSDHVEVEADGQRLVVSAKEELVVRCGKASITLTRAGKVLINGTYVSNRSSGVLRLNGGSVQIN